MVLIVIIGSVLAVTIALVTTTLACCKSESNVEDSRQRFTAEPNIHKYAIRTSKRLRLENW